VETETLDKAIIASVSTQAARRDAAAEQRSRHRIAAIAGERASLQKTLAVEFPDCASLSDPLPLAVKKIQALLSADEAMALYSVVGKESYVVSTTRDGVDWRQIALGADHLDFRPAQKRTKHRQSGSVAARDANLSR
jgi:hypothetical protein